MSTINSTHAFLIVTVMVIITAITRMTAFLVFDHGQDLPRIAKYLGKTLPPAVMSFLLIYCLKGIDFTKGQRGIPEIVCTVLALVLHAIKRSVFLSICLSTALYMIMIRPELVHKILGMLHIL